MKENQRIAVTKRMLKEGLLRLLEKKDLDKIRVNELCEESGINRATFYRHYEMPQDLLIELEKDFVQQMVPLNRKTQSLQDAKIQMEKACAYIYDHADIAKILFRCNTDADMKRRFDDVYRQFWELRKTEKQFAHMDDATAHVIIALLGGGCYCLIREWILADIPKTPKEIAAIMCNVIRWPASTDFQLTGTT